MIELSIEQLEKENKALKAQVQQLSIQKDQYKKLFDVSADALSILDLDSGKFIECNQAAVNMHGVDNEDNFLRLRPSDISPEFQPCGQPSLELAIARIKKSYTEGPQVFQWLHSKLNGSTFPCLVSLTALPVNNKRLILAIGRDITELENKTKELEKLNKKLLEMSNCDYLTGLYNRRYLDKIIQYEVKRSKRYRTKLSCILIDIDDFKKVNDSHGHAVGDKALVTLAKIIKNYARETDVCARWGGEEFCILLPDIDANNATFIAERYRCLIENYTFHDASSLTVSIGVSEFIPNEPIDSLFKKVDDALYQAKNSGKNKISVFRTTSLNNT